MRLNPININSVGKTIELYYGIFGVYVLGGWDIDVNNFNFTLKNIKTHKIVQPRTTLWRVQSYEFGVKAKKIMILDITQSGQYNIEFKNQDQLKVWKSKFPIITRFFRHPIKKQNIQICII